MEEVPDSQIYRLYLNSFPGFPGITSNIDKFNVSWLVDYDSMFSSANYKYKHCRLRYKFLSDPAVVANVNHTASKGVLVVNGLSSANNSKNVGGIVLDNIIPVQSTSLAWFDNSSMDTVGIDILPPYGLSTLNVQLWGPEYGCQIGSVPTLISTFTPNYTIIFAFELYNPK